jgi:hypothetical protein
MGAIMTVPNGESNSTNQTPLNNPILRPMETPITPKQLKGYKRARLDKWAPSANDNYNLATFGITAAEYHRVHRAVVALYGMFIPRTLPSLAVLNEQYTSNPRA